MNSYERWMKKLNEIAMADLGQTVDNFDDYNWFDEWENFVEPQDAYDEWNLHTEGGTRSPCC